MVISRPSSTVLTPEGVRDGLAGHQAPGGVMIPYIIKTGTTIRMSAALACKNGDFGGDAMASGSPRRPTIRLNTPVLKACSRR